MVFLASGQYTLSLRTYAPYRKVVRSTQRHDMEPFRRLTRKDTPWHWSDERDSAFRKIQHMVREASLLSYYDPSLPCVMRAKVDWVQLCYRTADSLSMQADR